MQSRLYAVLHQAVKRLAAESSRGVDQTGAVRVVESDRVSLVDVTEAGRAGRPVERRHDVRCVVRSHVVHGRAIGGRCEAAYECVGPATEVAARGEHERRDASRVRGGHRGALEPAEAGAPGGEAGRVERGAGKRVGADEALLGERAERAPAAGEHVAVAAVVAGDLEAPRAAGGGEVDAGAVVRVVGELVARAYVGAPAQWNVSGGGADRVGRCRHHRYPGDAAGNRQGTAIVVVLERLVSRRGRRDALAAGRDLADALEQAAA